MFKKITLLMVILTLLVGVFSACLNNDNAKDTEKNNKAKPSVTAGIAVEDVDLEGIPDGFPTDAVPIYENPEIIDSSTFGEDGYSITYSVNDVYDNVVGFYMTNIEGLDESGIGDDESYFEGIDVGDVHINGITITDNGNKTTVFITLRNYKSGSDNNIEENDEDVGEADSSLITYANAKEEKLDKKYPSDVVPIFPKAKVIGCSLAPRGSGFVDLVLAPDAFNDAVDFYKNQLGFTPKSIKTQVMESESFTGEKDGWKVNVLIGHLLADNNDPYVTITVDKK